MSYPWIKDSQYLPVPVTGYLAVTSPNGIYAPGPLNLLSAGDLTTTSSGSTILDAMGNSITIGNGGADNITVNAVDSISLLAQSGFLDLNVNSVSGQVRINPSTNDGTLTCATVVGNLSGNATTATTATTATCADKVDVKLQTLDGTFNLGMFAGVGCQDTKIVSELTYQWDNKELKTVSPYGTYGNPLLSLHSTRADQDGPYIDLYANKALISAGDDLGAIAFSGNGNGADTKQEYGRIQGEIRNKETDGRILFRPLKANVITTTFEVSSDGIQVPFQLRDSAFQAGTNGQVLSSTGTGVSWTSPMKFAIIQETKAVGEASGVFWLPRAVTPFIRPRQFNSKTEAGLSITLGGPPNYTFTIPTAGTYQIEANAYFSSPEPDQQTVFSKMFLNNQTLGLAVIVGDSNRYGPITTANSMLNSNIPCFLSGIVAIQGITIFSLDHHIKSANAAPTGGQPVNVSDAIEIYATLKITKLS